MIVDLELFPLQTISEWKLWLKGCLALFDAQFVGRVGRGREGEGGSLELLNCERNLKAGNLDLTVNG